MLWCSSGAFEARTDGASRSRFYLGIMFNLYTVLSFGQDNPKNRLYCSYIILTLSSICEGAGVVAHLTRFGKVLKNLLFS